MKSGYDQFFKTARKVAEEEKPFASVQLKRASTQTRKSQIDETKIMAKNLRERVRPKMNRKPRPMRWKMAAVSFVGLILTVGALMNIDEIDHLVKNIEISMMGQAYAEDTKPAVAEKPKVEEKPATTVKKDFTPEEVNHLSRLNERKRELDAREEELSRMEQELSAQKAELDKKLAEIEKTRKNISTALEEKVQGDDKKVESLVQLYSNMKPQQAAKAFEDMDENLAIDIMGRMKKKNAAEIMNLVKPEKLKIFSERYSGYRRN
jgi:flagellar motility protein MotE (MotC chaperone)